MTTLDTGITESRGRSQAGIPWLVADIVIFLTSIVLYIVGGANASGPVILLAILLTLTFVFITPGFFMIQPNQSAVLTLFGDYRGSDPNPGLRWANPLYLKKKVSLQVRNFTTQTSKVNDARGNPIEIAAVVVWRVIDTADGGTVHLYETALYLSPGFLQFEYPAGQIGFAGYTN